jgi:hypothetical protein
VVLMGQKIDKDKVSLIGHCQKSKTAKQLNRDYDRGAGSVLIPARSGVKRGGRELATFGI